MSSPACATDTNRLPQKKTPAIAVRRRSGPLDLKQDRGTSAAETQRSARQLAAERLRQRCVMHRLVRSEAARDLRELAIAEGRDHAEVRVGGAQLETLCEREHVT